MDPKKLSGIDPKLQEAYNRVMATPTPSSSPASPTKNEINAAQPVPGSVSEPAAATGQATTPPPLPTLTPIESHKNTNTNSQAPNSNRPPVGMVAKSGGGGIPPAVLVVAAVIFFLVYTLFFIKLFNVSVPFLP